MRIKTTVLGAAAGLALAAATPVLAQDTEAPQAQPEQQQQVTQEQLEAFADAALAVEGVGQTWVPQIEAAADEQEATDLRLQAQSEMVSAVEAEGLTVAEYNRIYELAQADPDIQARILAIIQADEQ